MTKNLGFFSWNLPFKKKKKQFLHESYSALNNVNEGMKLNSSSGQKKTKTPSEMKNKTHLSPSILKSLKGKKKQLLREKLYMWKLHPIKKQKQMDVRELHPVHGTETTHPNIRKLLLQNYLIHSHHCHHHNYHHLLKNAPKKKETPASNPTQ